MQYSLSTLSEVPTDPVEFAMWMNNEDFIATGASVCNHCEHQMIFQESTHFQADSVCLRCTNPTCARYGSVRISSFFSKRHMSLRQQMQLIIAFVADSTVSATARQYGLRRQTVGTFFDDCREQYQKALDEKPIQFSHGQFEVDECLLTHVRNELNVLLPIQWVVGIFQREIGQVLMYRIADRKKVSILPPLYEHIPMGSFVYSDDLATYHSLDTHYLHYSVNHSQGEFAREDEWRDFPLNVTIGAMEKVWSKLR